MPVIYAVHVKHSAHEEPPRMILLTPDICLALDTAFSIERTGFRFESGDGVWVSRLEVGRFYDVHAYRFPGKPPKEYPIVLSRNKRYGFWHDSWYDQRIHGEYELARVTRRERTT